jgi:hypothetical protein
MKESKIVQPEDVDFGDASPTPDTIEAIVVPSSNTNSLWQKENMQLMVTRTTPLLEHLYTERTTGFVPTTFSYGAEKEIFPTILLMKHVSRGNFRQLVFESIPIDFIRWYLMNIYGDELEETGVFESADLLPGMNPNFGLLAIYAPEVNDIMRVNNKFIRISDNPWLSLYAMPIAERPFFAGVLAYVEKQNPTLNWQDVCKNTTGFSRPLTFKNILDYARVVGEVKRAKQYADSYRGFL